MSTEKIIREFKGKRLDVCPTNYVVVDIETTGTSSKYNEIIEVACIKYENNCEVDAFSSFVHINSSLTSFISELTGITDKDLADAPPLENVIENFINFVSDDIIVGYNVNFDIRFLYDRCMKLFGIPLENNYVDVYLLAKKKLPKTGMKNYELSTVANYFKIDTKGAHRALNDCYVTNACLENLIKLADCNNPASAKNPVSEKEPRNSTSKSIVYTAKTQSLQCLQEILLEITSDDVLTQNQVLCLKRWTDENMHLHGNFPFDEVSKVLDGIEDKVLKQSELNDMLNLLKQLTNPNDTFCDTDCELDSTQIAGKKFCITGNFENIDRNLLIEKLKAKGIFVNDVSKNTDFLVLGSLGSERYANGNYGSKTKTAIEIKRNGGNIKIISEEIFWDTLGEYLGCEGD